MLGLLKSKRLFVATLIEAAGERQYHQSQQQGNTKTLGGIQMTSQSRKG